MQLWLSFQVVNLGTSTSYTPAYEYSLTAHGEIGVTTMYLRLAGSCKCQLPAECTTAQFKPQGTGPKWSLHCRPPMAIFKAMYDKESWPVSVTPLTETLR